MLKSIYILSVLVIHFCYATSSSNPDVGNSQMATLTERMNQMISSLYTPSLLSKPSPSPPTPLSSDSPTSAHESPPYTYSGYTSPATMFYVPPFPSLPALSPPHPACYLETGLQPYDYGYPGKSNHYPPAAYPATYGYDYNYSQLPFPPVPYTSPPYPPAYPCQCPQVPKSSPYPYSEYPVPYQPRSVNPPTFPLPPHHPPASPYSNPYYSVSPPYPQPSPPPPSFYPQPPYLKHSDITPSPHYP